jgi:hypothetical protein
VVVLVWFLHFIHLQDCTLILPCPSSLCLGLGLPLLLLQRRRQRLLLRLLLPRWLPQDPCRLLQVVWSLRSINSCRPAVSDQYADCLPPVESCCCIGQKRLE